MNYLDLYELCSSILVGLGDFVSSIFDFLSYNVPGVSLSVAEILFGSGVVVYLTLRVVFS